MPTRRVQHRAPATARIRQSRCTLAIPGARPGAHQRAGYLGTSLNEQLGLQIRPGRGRRVATLPTNWPPRSWPHCSASQLTPPAGRTRQTRLDRLHRRTGRTTLGTPADVTDTDGTAPLLCVEWWRHKSPQLSAPVTAPSPGTFAGGCYGNLRRKFGGHLRRGPTSPLKVAQSGRPANDEQLPNLPA